MLIYRILICGALKKSLPKMVRPARFPPIACPCGEALQERPLTLYDDGEQGLRKLIFACLQWKLERDTGQVING